MTFDDVVNEVLGLIKRPDKILAVQSAVNSHLSRCVLKTNFTHDLVEGDMPLDNTVYSQTIDLVQLSLPLTRFRKWKYLKLPGATKYLNPIDPQNVFTPGGFTQSDGYYMIGTNLTIITSLLSDKLLFGYYQYAPTLSGAQTHWLLDVCPFAIVNKAAADLFNSMGDQAASKYYLAVGEEMYNIVVNDLRDQITY
jgi:hypothetical protein